MGFTSPRYILPVSNSKAYVSDLYANKINIVNLNNNTVSSSISCQGWTEEMVMVYNKVFVTNKKRDYVFVIDALSDSKEDSIHVGYNSSSIVVDKYDKIWVMSAGNTTTSVLPSLKRIDPLTKQVDKSFSFTSADTPGSLCINKTKDTLYFLNQGIFRMDISSGSLPLAAFISKGSKTFYGLGVNKNDYTIYASDALDYIQKSNIYIYDASGNQKSLFKAGINSNSFYFE
jgi:DNA-binding beta-propeller fold protein YncE